MKQTLLLVDGDVQSLRVLEVSLRDAGFAVHTARNGAEALTKAASVPPDLILTDTALPVLDGFELCKRLKADPALGDAALVFLSADGAVETKVRGLEMGAEDYLVRPITTREVIARVRLLLQRRDRERAERAPGRRRLAGRLEDMGVVDLLQTMAIGHKSGTLRVERPPHQATIWFRGGAVIDATSGPLTGDEAVYRLLTWSSGEFEIDFHTPTKPQTMSISTAHLLMEGMRRLDEWGRIREQLPPLELVFEVDYEVLSDRLADLPDEANVLLRYLDGRRTGHEVIDDSDLPDLTALELMSRLYFEGVIQPGATAPRRVIADAPPALVSQTAKTNPAKPAPMAESLGDVLARSAVRHSAEYPAVPDPAPAPALAWGNVP
ncbi:MAG: DUF4388 domain-containing protein, partial [Myxococcales bacterium]|nr:DUF4388 domain-containing protein [Myxococcales bacterium]